MQLNSNFVYSFIEGKDLLDRRTSKLHLNTVSSENNVSSKAGQGLNSQQKLGINILGDGAILEENEELENK